MRRSIQRNRQIARGAYALELALLFPVVIVLILGIIDISTILRNKNALKAGVEATVRCLRTTDSDCNEQNSSSPIGSPLYRVYAEPPPSYEGDTHRYTVRATSYKAPELDARITADILATVTSVEQQQRRYPVTYEAQKHVTYVVEDFGYTIAGFSSPVAYTVNQGSAVAVPHTEPTSGGGNWNITSGDGTRVLSRFTVPVPKNYSAIQTTPCYQGSITVGQAALPSNCLIQVQKSGLLVPVMIAIKGAARSVGASQGSTTSLGLALNYNGTTIGLGGRQFTPPSPGSVSTANFVPRGAIPGSITGSAVAEYKEPELYSAETTYVPVGQEVTLTLAISEATNATWELADIVIFAPNFTMAEVDLPCVLATNASKHSRQSCSSLAKGSCHTVPEIAGAGTITLGEPYATKRAIENARCHPAELPVTDQGQPVTISGKTCNDYVVDTSGASTCSPITVEHTCSNDNFGTEAIPGPDGRIHGGAELLAMCNATARRVAGVAPVNSQETLATERRITVQEHVRLSLTNCGQAARKSALTELAGSYTKPHLSDVKETGNLEDVTSWPVPNNDVSCLKAAQITSSTEASSFSDALGGLSYLLDSHPDLGCSESDVLNQATNTLASKGLLNSTFEKISTGTFSIGHPKNVDSCTALHLKPIDQTDRRFLGTFKSDSFPTECQQSPGCSRDLAGFSSQTGENDPADATTRIARAVSKGVATATIYAGQPISKDAITVEENGTDITVTGSVPVRLILQRNPRTLTYGQSSISELAAME